MSEPFWDICPVCKGKGEVPALLSKNSKNQPTGSIVADRKHSYCWNCHGPGIVLKKEPK